MPAKGSYKGFEVVLLGVADACERHAARQDVRLLDAQAEVTGNMDVTKYNCVKGRITY